MRRLTFVLPVLVVASCQTGPVLMSYKAGTTFPQRQADYDQCKIAALNMVPSAPATDYKPGYYNPGVVQCSTIGNYTSCNRVGAVSIPGSVTTYDRNQNLRDREIARCMASKGYQFLDRPICSSDEERRRASYDPQPPSASSVKCSGGVSLDG